MGAGIDLVADREVGSERGRHPAIRQNNLPSVVCDIPRERGHPDDGEPVIRDLVWCLELGVEGGGLRVENGGLRVKGGG